MIVSGISRVMSTRQRSTVEQAGRARVALLIRSCISLPRGAASEGCRCWRFKGSGALARIS